MDLQITVPDILESQHWTYNFLNATTFILGSKKNAGKTTFMNLALSHIRKVTSPAICSIGLDGESNDLIDGRNKPSILTAEGDYLVTTHTMLAKSNGQFQLMKAFPFKTVLGQIIIAKTIRVGNIELVGTENNLQLNEVIQYLKEELDCKTIVIDGAANRLTPVASGNKAAFYYVVYIDHKNLNKVMDNMNVLSFLSSCKSIDTVENVDVNEVYKVNGALTVSKLDAVPEDCSQIIINNISSVFLTYNQLRELCLQKQLVIEQSYPLKGFVTVLKDVQEDKFKLLYQQQNIKTPLITNPYVN